MSTQIRWLTAVTALFALACGRTDLEIPEDVPYADVPVAQDGDAGDVPMDSRPCRTDVDCDDRSFCNGQEACVAGVCHAGPAVDCSDRVSCTADRCDESTRMCLHAANDALCPPGQRCDLARGCTAQACTSNAQCDDGNVCNGVESCRGGTCVIGPPPFCDDGVSCTIDSCDPRRGCVNVPDNRRCDDGVFCNGAEICNIMAGTCQRVSPITCDDGNPCTTDRCDEGTRSCSNIRRDDDGDGFVSNRCGGPDCDDTNASVHPGVPESCSDGLDNDCNGLTDCADPRCAGTPICGPCIPSGPEVGPAFCSDGRDNDCDGLVDCGDPDCSSSPMCCRFAMPENSDFACRDGRDNDCNGLIDCMDPGCAGVASCRMCVPTGPENCSDGLDNDCNGSTDCADGVCTMTSACTAPNDTCTTAIPITVPGRASGSTRAAADDYQGPCASSNGGDVVFVMNNPTRQTIIIDTIGSNYDTVLYVRQSNCMTGASVGCDDDSGGSLTSLVTLTNADPGTYYIFVDGWGMSSGDFQLHVRLVAREICNNGIDDDANGLIDCADPACVTDPACIVCMPTGPENNPFACGDGRDDDCNGLVDCLDPGCRGIGPCGMCVPTGPENNPFACRDGVDNDCDGAIDCVDRDCIGVPTCGCVPTGAENNDFACSDGRDNDCDGRVDCADTGCASVMICMVCVPTGPENNSSACSDGRDNDCNGLRDCADPACSGIAPCACLPSPEVCNDGRDNDCDGHIDCDDTDCRTSPFCFVCTPTGPETNNMVCADGRDNDCDGLLDCADPDCAMTTTCGACMPTGLENTAAACSDGRDNDCDRLIDCADSDCRATSACTTCVPENTATLCANGRDDDCDSLIDCADPDCAMVPACAICTPTGAENTDATCSDGRDNDCDRAIDCADPGCAAATPCRPPPPNDNCTSPILVGVPSTTFGTTVGATNDYTPTTAGFPGCAGGNGADLVYTFNITASTPLTIDLTGSYDTVVYVRRDTCSTGTQTACNDDSGATTNSRVAFVAAPGTYYVFVDGYSTGSAGTFTLRIAVGLPAEICTNGIDDNGNGLIDCADPDCTGTPTCACMPTGPENTPSACTDGVDNDCNSLTDCADPRCAVLPVCMPCLPTGPENTAAACSDGRDNDCNGLTDCGDPACAGTTTCCRPTGPENTAAACGDGRDNDCNGLIDCMDPGCATTPACCGLATEVCNDGRDNNCNGLTDCSDPACSTFPACMMCVPTSPRETGVSQCTDGRDNDCDRTTDCNDSDCRPFGAGTECCNGSDDNANGIIDEFSCACTTNADCTSIGLGGRFPSNVCYTATFHVCGINCGLVGGDLFCNSVLAGSHCDSVTGQCR